MSAIDPPPDAGTAAPPPPGILRAFVSVLSRPATFFRSIRPQTSLGPPLLFAAVMLLLAAAVRAIALRELAYQVLGEATQGPEAARSAWIGMHLAGAVINALLWSLIGGGVVLGISAIAGGKGTYRQSVWIASYPLALSPIAAVIGAILIATMRERPMDAYRAGIVGNTIVSLYGLHLVRSGLVAVHDAPPRRALLVAGAIGVILVAIGLARMA